MNKIFLIIALFLTQFLTAQNWNYTLQEAKTKAQQENKNIILVFSGSDWCAPCIKLDKNIWMSEEFKKIAAEKWVLLRADFPKKKANKLSEAQTKENGMLAEKYNKEGNFPLVVMLTKEGKVLGKTGFKNISPTEYIELLKKFEQ